MSKFRGKQKTKEAAISLTIIGGKYRRTKIYAPEIKHLRPTSNRVRETLFNWLQFDIEGARVLDLFAGSGALALEAVSRGATEAILVDSDYQAIEAIRLSIQKLNEVQMSAMHLESRQFLASAHSPFDLVFIDPPFELNLWQETVSLLDQSSCLHSGSRIYIESPRDVECVFPNNWRLIKQKTMGSIQMHLIRVE